MATEPREARNPSADLHGSPAAGTAAKGKATLTVTSDCELLIERSFNAPQHLVFAAWTDAELVKRWWAPRSLCVSVASCTADVRVGGKYRYVLRNPDGNELGFSGTYREVTPTSRLVYDQVFEPMAHAGAAVITVEFQARGDKTHMVSRERYPSKQVLESVLASGMEHGMQDTLEQLDELVAELARA